MKPSLQQREWTYPLPPQVSLYHLVINPTLMFRSSCLQATTDLLSVTINYFACSRIFYKWNHILSTLLFGFFHSECNYQHILIVQINGIHWYLKCAYIMHWSCSSTFFYCFPFFPLLPPATPPSQSLGCLLLLSCYSISFFFCSLHIWEKTCHTCIFGLFCLTWYLPVPPIFLPRRGFSSSLFHSSV